MLKTFQRLNDTIIHCRKCPRLVHFRETVPPDKQYSNQEYWRKPLPGFGDENGWLLITGLAPAAQGGNRTGRIFTGDDSGRFLMKALHAEGFANQPTSESKDDGLQLKGCYITAAVKCAPPKHKPTKEEFLNCCGYYHNELFLLKNVTAVLALGQFAMDAYLFYVKSKGQNISKLKFVHGKQYEFEDLPTLIACYHPSRRNTNTGLLTQDMMRTILDQIKRKKAR